MPVKNFFSRPHHGVHRPVSITSIYNIISIEKKAFSILVSHTVFHIASKIVQVNVMFPISKIYLRETIDSGSWCGKSIRENQAVENNRVDVSDIYIICSGVSWLKQSFNS